MATDVEKEVELIVSITLDEFIDFLAERNAEKPCEACDRTVEWRVRTDGTHPILTQMTFYKAPDEVDLFCSVFCPECGNTRLFNARYVGAFVKLHREAKNGQR